MSNILLALIGIVCAIFIVIMAFSHFGDKLMSAKDDTVAARFVSEASQISRAYDMYHAQEGGYPTGENYPSENLDQSRLKELVDKGYLKAIPQGGKKGSSDPLVTEWYIDNERGTAMTLIGTDDSSLRICAIARRQSGFSGEISDIKSCSALNIAVNDPCCRAL